MGLRSNSIKAPQTHFVLQNPGNFLEPPFKEILNDRKGKGQAEGGYYEKALGKDLQQRLNRS